MKVFLDTNILLEQLLHREEYESVYPIFISASQEEHEYYISVGCIYTLAYVVDREFKRKGMSKDDRLNLIRSTFESILTLFKLSNSENSSMIHATQDISFDDIEDSFQYRSAIDAGCDIIITLNTKDFEKSIDDKLKVVSPQNFCVQYLS